ncbi:MAG: RluA family pseudouridine synthase [Rubrivivax sp.]
MPPAIEVLYADADLLVVDKPAGVLSVPGRGADKQDCVLSSLLVEWPDARVVHRLDMATSGVMLLARGAPMQRAMSQLFAQRAVHKCYVAVVVGRPALDAGSIELPLSADWPRRPLQKVDVAGKPALTHWRVLHHDPVTDTTRLALRPVTGRTRQLRLHLQAVGHPIVGDLLYAPSLYAASEGQAGAARMLLHAHELRWVHPGTGRCVSVRSDVPF